ncbi:hypothetical protein [Prevotella sp. 10(H)]|uniref:hypothetical protein n=1 Tax=Prevotella sp. 10(H) TaxID=1158294 RepID=UPI0004A78249|nr:hypothetical protein [Prevotella sp. 10(H)]
MSVKQKLLFLLLLLIVSISYSLGQTIDKECLFDQFQKGKVMFTDGKTAERLFNYNMVAEKLLYLSEDSTVMELIHPETVVFLKVDDRTFEHIKNGVLYERVSAGKSSVFYIRWRKTMLSETRKGPYGTDSPTGNISNISHIYSPSGNVIKLKKDHDYTITPDNAYFLKVKKTFKRLSSVNDLAKFFKGHEKSIKKYAKDENIKFDHPQDIKRIIAYCEQLY